MSVLGLAARPEILEKRVVFDFLVVGVQDHLSQGGYFFLCFLGAHFDMFRHYLFDSLSIDFSRRKLSNANGVVNFAFFQWVKGGF